MDNKCKLNDFEKGKCAPNNWEIYRTEIFNRKNLWRKIDNEGYETTLMINNMPIELKEKGVKENFIIHYIEPFSPGRVLGSFKKQSQALKFAKEFMEKE